MGCGTRGGAASGLLFDNQPTTRTFRVLFVDVKTYLNHSKRTVGCRIVADVVSPMKYSVETWVAVHGVAPHQDCILTINRLHVRLECYL
jgi:hypothetical protein